MSNLTLNTLAVHIDLTLDWGVEVAFNTQFDYKLNAKPILKFLSAPLREATQNYIYKISLYIRIYKSDLQIDPQMITHESCN